MENMSVVQWHGKRIVTTMHSEKPERRLRSAPGGHEVVEKPEAVVEYKKFMGGDRGDQLLSYYGFPHRTVNWCEEPFYSYLMQQS